MNANELADNLLKNGGNCSWFKEIAAMLRQQQAELDRAVELYTDKAIENEALKAGKIRAYDNGVEDGRKPNTHPVKEQDAIRYRWLRAEFEAGRETYLAEGIPSGERLDEYIDEKLRKAQEK